MPQIGIVGLHMQEVSSTDGAALALATPFPEPIVRVFGAKAIDDLMRAPGFPAAIRAAAGNAVRLYDGNWLRNRLLNDCLLYTSPSPRDS